MLVHLHKQLKLMGKLLTRMLGVNKMDKHVPNKPSLFTLDLEGMLRMRHLLVQGKQLNMLLKHT